MHHETRNSRTGRALGLIAAGCLGGAIVMGLGQFVAPAQAGTASDSPRCGSYNGVPMIELRDGSVALVGGADGQYYIVGPNATAVEVRGSRRHLLYWR